MVRRFVFTVVCAVLVAASADAAEVVAAGGLAGLEKQAQQAGRVRVVVELKASAHVSRLHLRGLQHRVIGPVLGGGAWRGRDGGKEPHAVELMRTTPAFAASVTAAELDRLAANRRVRRIREDVRPAQAAGGTPTAP